MIYVGVGIVVMFIPVLMVFLWDYLFLKHPVHPPIEERTLETFPQEVQEYFSQVIPVLEDEGFDVVCYCGQTTPGPEYFILLKHRNKQDIATVTSGPPCDAKQSWRRFIEFTTKMNSVVMQTNNNRHQPLFDLQAVDIKRYNVPTIYDLHELYLLHRALVRRHAGDAVPCLWEDGKELGQFKHVFIKKLKGEAEYGLMYVDPTSNVYRPTLKGAFFVALLTPLECLLLWPFGGIRRWLVSRRTTRIIKDIAETRKLVEQEDMSTQRFSTEQRRSHQERREPEQKAAFLENVAAANYPILREEHQAIGFLVDIDETFQGKPVKPAVGLPEWPVYIFLPMAALLTPVAITTTFRTGNMFVQSLPLVSFKMLIILLFWAVAALICGFATLRFFLLIVNEFKALYTLSQHGQVTIALIVELCRHGGKGAFSSSTEYTMLYRFQAFHVSGLLTTITGRQKISKQVYETYRTQKTVNVRYVPTKPEWFKLDL